MSIIDKMVNLVGTTIVGLIVYAIGFIVMVGGIHFIANICYKMKNLNKNKNRKIMNYKNDNFKSNEEMANYIYSYAMTKFNLLDGIIKQTDIMKKYAYEDDYYVLMAYMDILNFYTIRVRKNYSEKNLNQILSNYFQMVSNNLINNKYKKSGNQMMENYVGYILPTFEFAIRGKETPYLYTGMVFLSSVFNISMTELETNYNHIIEQVADLFKSIYIDEDISLI